MALEIRQQIDAAIDAGWVVILIDETYFGERYTPGDICRFEADYALAENSRYPESRLLPVVIGDPIISMANAPSELKQLQYFDLYTDFRKGILELIKHMRTHR